MKEKIISMLREITPSAFELKTDDNNYARFERVDNRVLVINLGNILDGELNSRLNAWVSFFSIESIIRPAFAKDCNTDSSITIALNEHRLLTGTPRNEPIYDNLPLAIDSDAALERTRVLIQQFIEQDALPFFSYWSDIRRFLPYLETEDIVVVANDVFYNEGMKKKLIVWWLCGHPNYGKFKRERLAVYEDEMETLDAYDQRCYKSLLTTIKRLEKVKPLYEWDSSWLEQR